MWDRKHLHRLTDWSSSRCWGTKGSQHALLAKLWAGEIPHSVPVGIWLHKLPWERLWPYLQKLQECNVHDPAITPLRTSAKIWNDWYSVYKSKSLEAAHVCDQRTGWTNWVTFSQWNTMQLQRKQKPFFCWAVEWLTDCVKSTENKMSACLCSEHKEDVVGKGRTSEAGTEMKGSLVNCVLVGRFDFETVQVVCIIKN